MRPPSVRFSDIASLRCLPASLCLAGAALLLPSVLGAQIAPSARKQIEEVYAFKASLSPAEQKMSSNLVLNYRIAQHKNVGNLAHFASPLPHDSEGRIEVEVNGYMTPGLLSSPAMKFSEKVNDSIPVGAFQTGKIRTHVKEAQLLELASSADVTRISEPLGYHTNVGSVTSQGYVAHRANGVVPGGVNGTGIKVGVLSDSASATRVAALIASGDLPANTVVLPGQVGSGEDEGAAMMEIVHDIAPGAQIFFATADPSEAQFATNIRALRFTYGCDIIVDDISYFDESVFQDGTVANAVNDVVAAGGMYFSAAANSGNLTSGTSGTWEGDFTSGGTTSLITNLEGSPVALNNFGTVSSAQTYDTLTSAASSGVWLHWADPNGGSSNDYDLFVLNSTGTTVKGYSAGTQTGTQNPLEYVYPSSTCNTATPTGYCPAAGDRIVVALYSGAARALHIDTERATLSIGTPGATFGHNGGANTFSMAAVYWNSARRGAIPFTGGIANPDEAFSSDGPRKIFFNPDGSAITSGNFLFATNGGTTLIKPDAAAADGVSTATPGFLPFFGTSAAAPHAAGIAALVKSANPSLTNQQILSILRSTTLDNMESGIDRDSGYGILSVTNAVAAAKSIVQ
ncbi:MAG: S8 family peptidase [Janthinobacterium lividum]